MKVHFLGVRGSTPAPGAAFARFGGNTACVALSHDDVDQPTLVLDAGTGIRSLGGLLAGPAFHGAILLTHLHWDHLQGLPFFVQGDHPQTEADLYLPAQLGRSGRDLLAQVLSPPYFPIMPEGLQGRWGFHALSSGRSEIEGFVVEAFDVEHKGGRTFGYRVGDDSGSIAYLSDHAAVSRHHSLEGTLSGVDLLVHDAQFTEQEREIAARFAHSTVGDAVDLATACGAGRLVLFHHAPGRTDDALDAIGAGVRAPMEVLVAREGMVLRVGGRA